MTIRLHQEDQTLFREAIGFTAAETGFSPRLIEKDYYCSVLLNDLASLNSALVFKGGTLLAKVHAQFYRLSEDLDFSISTGPAATKKTRSESVAPVKAAIGKLPQRLAGFEVDSPLTGSNASTQYNAVVSYKSVLADQRETVKIEIGLREETMTELHEGKVRTLLLNPVRGTRLPNTWSDISPGKVSTLLASLQERLAPMHDWTKNAKTQADVKIHILDGLWGTLPQPPYTEADAERLADRVYDLVWQRALRAVNSSCRIASGA